MNEQQIINRIKEIEESLSKQLADIEQRQIKMYLELQRMHCEIKGQIKVPEGFETINKNGKTYIDISKIDVTGGNY